MNWPGPDAPRAEIDAFYRRHAPPPTPQHEAPAVENGPSIVCHSCGVVRVSVHKPICNGCLQMVPELAELLR